MKLICFIVMTAVNQLSDRMYLELLMYMVIMTAVNQLNERMYLEHINHLARHEAHLGPDA